MRKKNKIFLAGLLAVLMILLVSCGKKPVDQPTEAPVAQTPGISPLMRAAHRSIYAPCS